MRSIYFILFFGITILFWSCKKTDHQIIASNIQSFKLINEDKNFMPLQCCAGKNGCLTSFLDDSAKIQFEFVDFQGRVKWKMHLPFEYEMFGITHNGDSLFTVFGWLDSVISSAGLIQVSEKGTVVMKNFSANMNGLLYVSVSGSNFFIRGIKQLDNGNYLAFGHTYLSSGADAYLRVFTSANTAIGICWFPISNFENVIATDVIKLRNGGYAVFGSAYNNTNTPLNCFVAHLDDNFHLVWEKHCPISDTITSTLLNYPYDFTRELYENEDGSLIGIVNGYLQNHQIELIKFSSDGVLIDSLIIPNDYGYIISGRSELYIGINNYQFRNDCVATVQNTDRNINLLITANPDMFQYGQTLTVTPNNHTVIAVVDQNLNLISRTPFQSFYSDCVNSAFVTLDNKVGYYGTMNRFGQASTPFILIDN